ncbi:MAG: hypothetical protein RLZZ623_1586 [Actinomycetota bacterium]
MLRISADRVCTPDGVARNATVVVADHQIVAIEPAIGPVPERLLVPGFVDLQVNGIDDIDCATADGDDWNVLDQRLLQQGVTTWYPTLVTNRLAWYGAPLARIATALARDAATDAHVRPTLAGVHLEGPFLGGAAGAHRRDLIVAIDVEWIETLPHHVRLVTLGAEQVHAAAAIETLRRDNRVVSVGHSTASGEQFDQAVTAGATLVTHLFNGMSGLHHRTPGVAAWAITDDRVSASLIADGVHVHPRMLQLAFRALGPERCILVTDAVAWQAGTVGAVGIEFRDGAPRLPDGTLAGSALTMDEAIRVCVAAGIDVIDAVRAASTNPARLMGLNDRGTIAVGQRADLVALDTELAVEQVWVGGTPAR